MIALLLWACAAPEVAEPRAPSDPHGGMEVAAGRWLVGGKAMPYDAQPRHHAVEGARVLLSRADGGVEVWEAGALRTTIPADCSRAQCPVPQVGFVEGEVAVLHPQVGDVPKLTLAGQPVSLPEPVPWQGEPYRFLVPKKWGLGRRPLAVSPTGLWVIPGSDDDVVALSPDGPSMAWSDWRGRVHVGVPGDVPTQSWTAPPGAATRLLELAWSPSGARILARGGGQVVQVLQPGRADRVAGGAVSGAPQGAVLVDDLHAVGWTPMGVACLQLETLQIVGLWRPGNIRHAEVGPGGRTVAIAGEVAGVAAIDVARLCHLQE